jgi:hypothetical protein
LLNCAEVSSCQTGLLPAGPPAGAPAPAPEAVRPEAMVKMSKLDASSDEPMHLFPLQFDCPGFDQGNCHVHEPPKKKNMTTEVGESRERAGREQGE